MSAHSPARGGILPMKTAGTQHFIERTYRESGQFQWVRELVVNAVEAGATRVEFGIEWQSVENEGIYRRVIADNGCGMNADQLVTFFNTFGGGGKPIGGAHENYGVGSKTSLLPWNRYGMVVISWVNGDASMIWVKHDEASGEYGLKLEVCAGPQGDQTLEEVYAPYDDPKHGCDWAEVKPDWIEDHGTVIVLLGNSAIDSTVEGDPNREEKDIKGISSYLNRRFWEFSEGLEVYVDELRTNDRSNWPPMLRIAHGPPEGKRDRRTNFRRINGALTYIQYPFDKFTRGKLEDEGTVELDDGTEIDWYLWEGDRPHIQSYAAISGYIAVLYKNELYDVASHHATFRSFGISDNGVRSRLWLIIRPPVDPEEKFGVYPKTDRNSLLIKGGPNAGGSLPINEWAGEFADNMPGEIIEALAAGRRGASGSITDDHWRERLAERFGARWRLPRLRAQKDGSRTTDSEIDGEDAPIRQSKRQSPPSSSDSEDAPKKPRISTIFGKRAGIENAELGDALGGIPQYEFVGAEDVPPGMLAVWQPRHPKHKEGAVLINIQHPVLIQVIEYWQSQFADHHADSIQDDVVAVYGEIAVSKIAHSESLKGIIPAHKVETVLRSDEALTMSLLGLMAEDHLIATRVGGKYNKRKRHLAELKKPR
jgi:hypothetical protein